MLLKNVVKAALYACVAGAVLFGCGTGVGGGGDSNFFFDGLLAEQPGLYQHSGTIPAGSNDLISTMSMGSVVISGGSATIAIGAKDALYSVYIQFSNEPNVYYEYVLTEDDYLGIVNGLYLYTPVVHISQNSESLVNDNTVTIYIAVATPAGQLSSSANREITTQVVGSGLLQLALSWNSTSDVDLHVTMPPTTAGSTSRPHVYWNSKVLKNSNGDTLAHLDKDANAICLNDVRNENIYFRTLWDGLYLVYLNFFTACGSSASATDFTVSATANGRVLSGGSYLQSYRGNFATGEDQILGVITVRNGAVVATDYNASDVRALLSPSSLPKKPAAEKAVAVK